MNRKLLLVATFLVPLACSSSDDEDVVYHHVTVEPDKTKALYRGLGGVWEADFPDGVGRLELCEASDGTSEYVLKSSDTATRELVLNADNREGGFGCNRQGGTTEGKSATAVWRGSWSKTVRTADGSTTEVLAVKVYFNSIENLYPDVYPLAFQPEDDLWTFKHPSLVVPDTGEFRLDANLSAATRSASSTDDRGQLVFRKIGEAACGAPSDAGADGGDDGDAG